MQLETIVSEDRQAQLERLSREEPAAKYREAISKAKEAGRADGLMSVRRLMKGKVTQLAREIGKWKGRCEASRGPSGLAYAAVKDLPDDVLAYLTLKTVFGYGFMDKTLTALASQLGARAEEEGFFRKIKTTEPRAYKFLRATGVTDDSAVYYKGRRLKKATERMPNFDWEKWDSRKKAAVGARLISIMSEKIGLCEMQTVTVPYGKGWRSKGVLTFTKEAVQWLDQQDAIDQALHPMYLPMVEEPAPWTSMYDGGYRSLTRSLCRPLGQRGPWEQDPGDLQVAYQATNAVQSTPWCINEDMLEVIEHVWKQGWKVKGVPELDTLEPEPKPDHLDKSDPEYLRWRKNTAQIRGENRRRLSKQMAIVSTLRQARMFRKDNCIYFPHTLDWRGRIYPVPSGLTPQGNDVQKSLLKFAEAKPLGPDGMKWLEIYGATVAGLDKEPFHVRRAWVSNNQDVILHISESPLDHLQWLHGWERHGEVDKPLMFLAWCMDYAEALETGSSSIAVQMDGSCNGLQHYSAALRDEEGGRLTNLVPSDRPMDIYQVVADRLTDLLKTDTSDPRSKSWLASGLLTRTLTKRPTMTTPYSVTDQGVLDQTMDLMNKWRAEGDLPFPNDSTGYSHSHYINQPILQSIKGSFPGAVQAMEVLQETASILLKLGIPPRWEAPSGFNVLQDYRTFRKRELQTEVCGKIRKFRLRDETDRLDVRKGKAGIAPNVVHSLDAAHLMLTVCRMEDTSETPVSYSMIHDSFGCHAADAEAMARCLRETFIEIYEDKDVLQGILDDMRSRVPNEDAKDIEWPELPPKGALDLSRIVESLYFFG